MKKTLCCISTIFAFLFLPLLATAAPIITLSSNTFKLGEPVNVEIKNLPGNQKASFTITQAGVADPVVGYLIHTKGVKQGTWTAKGLHTPGDYEVRLFYNYPADFNVKARVKFKVIATQYNQPKTNTQAARPAQKPTKQTPVTYGVDGVMNVFRNAKPNAKPQEQKPKQQLQPQASRHQSVASASPSASAVSHGTNPATNFILKSFDKIWIPAKGKSIGTAKDVMQRLNALGYRQVGTNLGITEIIVNSTRVRAQFTCNKGRQCQPDGVVTGTTLNIRTGRSGQHFPNIATQSVAHMQKRLGKETNCSILKPQRASCEWSPAGAAGYQRYISLSATSSYPSSGAAMGISIHDIKQN